MTPASHLPVSPALDALEARMGELASLLSEMADALTSYPEAIRIVDSADADASGGKAATMTLHARAWPTIQELEQLLSNWRRLREMADRL